MTFDEELGPELAALQKEERNLMSQSDHEAQTRLIVNYDRQAWILINCQKLEAAWNTMKKQEFLCVVTGDRRALSANYRDQSEVLRGLGRYEPALTLLEKQELLCQETGDVPGLLMNYEARVSVLRERGQTSDMANTAWCEDAMRLLKTEEALCTTQAEFQVCCGSQAELFLDWRRMDKALEMLRKQEPRRDAAAFIRVRTSTD